MTPETVLAVVVSYVGNPLSMWLAINRKPFGWWIVAVTQAAFVAFAVVGGDWRFGGQVLCLGMGIYGVWRWQIRRTHEPAIGSAADRITIPKTGVYELSVAVPFQRAAERAEPIQTVLQVAQDALAELNHHDRQRAAELREQLELARS